LFEDADYDFAASRAYYAMFYLAEALPEQIAENRGLCANEKAMGGGTA